MISRAFIALALIASLAKAETLSDAIDTYIVAAAPGSSSPWTVTGTLGLTLTEGNSETITLTFGIEAIKKFDPWTLKLKLNSIYAESQSVQTANEHIFVQRLERAIDEISALFQEFYLEHDDEENLNYRAQLTVGYMRRLMKKKDFEMWGEIGAGILHEEFRATDDTEGILQLGVNWVWKITEQLTYTQIITIYPSLSNGGEFRLYWESVFSTPISERLDMRLSIIDKYDSDAPVGVDDNDLIITLTIAIKFTKGAK